MDELRLAYLEAMDIDVWMPRGERIAAAIAGSEPRLVVSPGNGELLCIALSAEEARLKLATDISGAMRSAPVWAWPAEGAIDTPDTVSLREAVAERLATEVLIFGEVAAARLFGSVVPAVLGAARMHVVPSLARLGKDREAKRILWKLMCDQGIAAT